MNKYVEGVVESIQRKGITKSLMLELSGESRKKEIIFFEDIISIRSKDGSLQSARVEDDNAVSVGDEVFLFKNDEDVAVKIYKEKEKLHKDLDASISNRDTMEGSLKDIDFMVKSLVFMISFFLISLTFSFGCIFIAFLSNSADKFMSDPSTGPAFFCGLYAFVGVIAIFVFRFLCKKSLLNEKKEKKRLQKMVDDFRKDHSEKGVEVSQEANVIVR